MYEFRYDTLLDEPFKYPTMLLSNGEWERRSEKVDDAAKKIGFFLVYVFMYLLVATAGFIGIVCRVHDGYKH